MTYLTTFLTVFTMLVPTYLFVRTAYPKDKNIL